MLDIAPDWTGGIDDFVATANAWLPRLLPLDRAARPKDEVNARLVRHYTTVGFLSLPTREGREARYGRRHLLQLLALRRVMADGLSGKALYSVLSGQDEAGLERLAQEGVTSELEAAASKETGDALSYLQNLKATPNTQTRQQLQPQQVRATAGERDVSSQFSTSLAIQPLFLTQPPQPSKAKRFAALSEPELAETRLPPARLWRVTPHPGLEINLGAEFRMPRSEEEWEDLLAELRRTIACVERI